MDEPPAVLTRLTPPFLALTLVVSAVPHAVSAQGHADVQDAQLWLQMNSQIPLSDTWQFIVEGQPRWDQNASHYEQVVLRAGLQRRLTPRLQLGAAYALVPRQTTRGTALMHQAYEQVVFVLPRLGRWTPQLRVREDQQYTPLWGGTAHRVRGQIRMSRTLARGPRWTLVAHEEVLVSWNRTPMGPDRGLDQHRLFAGVNHRLTRDLAVETGYMWQDLFEKGLRRERHNHIAVVQFQYRPARRGPLASRAG
jgi:hypothetical protein